MLALFATLGLISTTPAPQDGAPWIDSDPTTAAIFQELTVRQGDSSSSVPTVAQNVQGHGPERPFVNVVRWTDARPFRGKLVRVQQRARLDAANANTTVSLWARTRRSDGSLAFVDDGRDQATPSIEWVDLSSTAAVAADATDLAFGILVEGSTPVHLGDFELVVLGDAEDIDPRHEIPHRWLGGDEVESGVVEFPGAGPALRWTVFRPAGHSVADLPVLWTFADEPQVRRTFERGRAALAGMRWGQDPAVAIVQIEPAVPMETGEFVERVANTFEAVLRPMVANQLGGDPACHLLESRSEPVRRRLDGLADADPKIERASHPFLDEVLWAATFDSQPVPEISSHPRVAMRLARAQFDARGLEDLDLTSLLFDAALDELRHMPAIPVVQPWNHSLDGHDCGHDHSHDTGHDHSHDPAPSDGQ